MPLPRLKKQSSFERQTIDTLGYAGFDINVKILEGGRICAAQAWAVQGHGLECVKAKLALRFWQGCPALVALSEGPLRSFTKPGLDPGAS